jgi:hypothetical protein
LRPKWVGIVDPDCQLTFSSALLHGCLKRSCLKTKAAKMHQQGVFHEGAFARAVA